ncbi:HAUS augmin-like complex subunit 1 [Guaruba guarouba]
MKHSTSKPEISANQPARARLHLRNYKSHQPLRRSGHAGRWREARDGGGCPRPVEGDAAAGNGGRVRGAGFPEVQLCTPGPVAWIPPRAAGPGALPEPASLSPERGSFALPAGGTERCAVGSAGPRRSYMRGSWAETGSRRAFAPFSVLGEGRCGLGVCFAAESCVFTRYLLGDSPRSQLSVTTWLKKVFGDSPIPQYKVSEQAVNILRKLAEYNEARERDVSLVMEGLKEWSKEYKAEAKYLERLLSKELGLSTGKLSRNGTTYLDVLVSSAMTLETKDTSLASFICAINERTSEVYKIESENREMELELTNLVEKISTALKLQTQLEKDLKNTQELLEVKKAKVNHSSQDLLFLKVKCQESRKRVNAAEMELAATGFDTSLSHKSLVNLAEKLDRLQKDIVPLKKKVKSYRDLPANIPLAKVKVEELKRELNYLDEELSKQVEELTCDMQTPSGF